MDTILKHNLKANIKFRDSISFKIILLCAVASIIIISLINILASQKIKAAAADAKQAELKAATSEYSASLSAYGLDHSLAISQNFPVGNRRIIVTDTSFRIIFDSSDIDNFEGKTLYLPAVIQALNGNEHFSFDASQSPAMSAASSPVISRGRIVGAICIYDTDPSLTHIFSEFKSTLIILDIIIITFFFAAALIIVSLLRARISNLIKSVGKTGDKESIDKIPIEYNDEMSPIIREFNNIYERLNYVQQMRQAFVSDASHELRTPLAAIRLLCESITHTSNVDTDTVREFMEDIILEVDRMSHTAEKLLVLSKLDNGNRTAFAPVSLSDIVNKMITAFEPIAIDKGVNIKSYIEEDCSILGDMEGANQIIGNLIDNSIKYNNVGGTLRIYLFCKGTHCTFITDDTGIGIAPEYREHVFERFYRIDKSREHDGRGGSGLGLAIVKRNVESFGGTITISDSVNGGTRFTVVFPSLLSDEEARHI